ncbi:hypothetical protein L7F22_007866 [Adiantum nelumboides]|nr:hypothetical protein [Adiantum nelumboides]
MGLDSLVDPCWIGPDEIDEDVRRKGDDGAKDPGHLERHPGRAAVERVINRLGKAWHRGDETNKESDISTPIPAVRVPVEAVGLVELADVDLLALYDEKVGNHDGGQARSVGGVAEEKGDESLAAPDDVPGRRDDTDDGGKSVGTEAVDVPWRKRHRVVGKGDAVGAELVAERGQDKGSGDKEFGGARIELVQECGKVPDELAPELLAGRGDEDGRHSGQTAKKWESPHLRGAASLVARVTAEIGHIDRERRKEASDVADATDPSPPRAILVSHLRGAVDELAAALCNGDSPDEEDEKGGCDGDGLDEDEHSDLLDGQKGAEGLKCPVDEEGDEFRGRNVGRGGEGVVHGEKRGEEGSLEGEGAMSGTLICHHLATSQRTTAELP